MADKGRTRILTRRAGEVRNYRRMMRILACAAGGLAIATMALFLVSMLYTSQGSFTITVNKKDSLDFGLALSSDRSFNQSSSQIGFEQANITHNTETALPGDLDSETGGMKVMDDYVAYTFFAKNIGDKTFTYQYDLGFGSVTNNVDKAVRIQLFVDGEPTTYARVNANGTQIEGTVPFYSSSSVVNELITDFEPGEVTRFTVVIWLEGNDEECLDDILGGTMRLNMKMTVKETE